jgi:hypothetical protein
MVVRVVLALVLRVAAVHRVLEALRVLIEMTRPAPVGGGCALLGARSGHARTIRAGRKIGTPAVGRRI